jgi:hypothetical protein
MRPLLYTLIIGDTPYQKKAHSPRKAMEWAALKLQLKVGEVTEPLPGVYKAEIGEYLCFAVKTKPPKAQGNPPYGYIIKDGKYVEHPEEQKALDVIRQNQHLKKGELAALLTEKGFKKRSGLPFCRFQIDRIMRNMRLA